MKRVICIATIVLTAQLCFSQTQKGSMMWGVNVSTGSFGKKTTKNGDILSNGSKTTTKSFDIAAGPSALYFVYDNLAVGAAINIDYSTSKIENAQEGYATSTTKLHSFDFSFDPEVRKYFGRPGSKGQPWINAFGGLVTGSGKSKQNVSPTYSSDDDQTDNGWNVGAGIGYSHFFNKHIALQYFINFRHTYLKSKSHLTSVVGYDNTITYTTNDNSVNFGVGLQIHLL